MDYKEPDQKKIVDLVAPDRASEERSSYPAIAGYHILEKIGSGSLADVYKVRRDDIDDVFVAKILRREFADNPRTARRYVQEGAPKSSSSRILASPKCYREWKLSSSVCCKKILSAAINQSGS